MKTNFTPGPWKIKEDTFGCKNIVGNIVFENDNEDQEIFICTDIGYTTGLADENQDLSNAKLISSAPALFESLCEMLSLVYLKCGNIHDDVNKLVSKAEDLLNKVAISD